MVVLSWNQQNFVVGINYVWKYDYYKENGLLGKFSEERKCVHPGPKQLET